MSEFISCVALESGRLLAPLRAGLQSEVAFRRLLERFGWDVQIEPATMAAIRSAFAVVDLLDTAKELAEQIEDDSPDALVLAGELLDVLLAAMEGIRALKDRPADGLPFPLDQQEFREQFPSELMDFLLARYLERRRPLLFGVLVLLGVHEVERMVPEGAGRVPYSSHRLRWERLGEAVSDPEGLFRDVYGWGDVSARFDHVRLLRSLECFLIAGRLPVRCTAPRTELAERYYAASNPTLPEVQELVAPLLAGETDDGYVELGVLTLPIPPANDPGAPPCGLYFTPSLVGEVEGAIDLGMDWALELRGGFESAGGVGVELRPEGVTLQQALVTTNIDAEVALVGRPITPWIAIGMPGSHRIEVSGLRFAIGVRGPVDDPELILGIGTGDGTDAKIKVVLETGEGDGFIRQIFLGQPVAVEFAGLLAWSSKTGLAFSGGAGIEVRIPVSMPLPNVALTDLVIALRPLGGGIELSAGASGAAVLGPLGIAFDDLGFRMHALPTGAAELPGALGNLNVEYGFKPPKGFGVFLDSGVIAGAGFLAHDPAKERYAGIVMLGIYDTMLTAIGVLDTNVPNVPGGYSLVLIIAADFPAIQLGFGFTLNGVGGLAGAHRTLALDALRSGIRNHTVDSILFPEDAITDAPRIVNDLGSIFPVAEGRYVFGPMMLVGWGTPTLVEAELGFVLELPDPVRLAILGQLSMYLPRKDAAVVELHLDALGTIDFSQKRLAIDATLYDSHVAAFDVSGDMAMRLSWGDPPQFALAIGGFHPQFPAPANFPTLRRVTIALGESENPRISLQAYLALTSNTVQFGALAELYVEAAGFNLYGWLGFNALVNLSPFSFTTDFSAGLKLRRGSTVIAGIWLDATLSGPRPWHVVGRATVSVLFVDVSIAVDATFGSSTRIEVPPADPRPLLQAAIQDARNWSVTMPPAASQVVSLTAAPQGQPALRVDPAGGITLRQKVVPLGRTLTRFGPVKPVGPDRYHVDRVTIGGQQVADVEPIQDYFAPAQFEQMSDAQKLSRASFERMDSGVAIGRAAIAHGRGLAGAPTYDTVIIDASGRRQDGMYRPPATAQATADRRGAVARTPLKGARLTRFAPAPSKPPLAALEEERFVIASTTDLSIRIDITAAGSRGAVERALAEHVMRHPAECGRLQVVRTSELEVAA